MIEQQQQLKLRLLFVEIKGLLNIDWGKLSFDDDGFADVVMYRLQLQIKSWLCLHLTVRSQCLYGEGHRVHAMMDGC